MKIFRLNKTYSVVCEWANTRNGFKHVGHLIKDKVDIYQEKINYLNRTWEKFEYETIILRVIDNNHFMTDKEKRRFKNIINKKWGYIEVLK